MNSLFKHWLLLLVAAATFSIGIVGCGDDDEAPPPPPIAEVVPFQTNQGDVGFITLLPGTPTAVLIDLQKYQVEGTVASSNVQNGVIQPGSEVQVLQIIPYGGSEPWNGPPAGPGITDQPVVVTIMPGGAAAGD